MCEFFGVRSGDSRNNKNIRDAIAKLEAGGLLKQIIDGRTFTLTLSKKGEQRKRVISIQKEWVEIAKNYKAEDPDHSISWMNLLKVWLYLIDNKKEIIKTSEIAEALGISSSTVAFQNIVESKKKEKVALRDCLLKVGKAGTKQNPLSCTAKITLASNPVLRKSPYAGMLFNGMGRPINFDGQANTLPASMGGRSDSWTCW